MTREREEAYRDLIKYLINTDGLAPEFGNEGLWVDLYDEIVQEMDKN